MPARIVVDVVEAPPVAIIAQSYFLAAERYEDLLDPMYESIELFSEQIKRNFDTESEGGLVPFEEWSIFYRQKRRDMIETKEFQNVRGVFEWQKINRGPGKILQLSGELFKQATDTASWDVDAGTATATAVIENVPGYGLAHLSGAPQIFLPVRNWAFLPDELLDDVDEVFNNHFDEPMS